MSLSKNPFRSPKEAEQVMAPPPSSPPPLPQGTASSSSSSSSSNPTLISSSNMPASSGHDPSSQAAALADDFDDELPPPYTPNAAIGEETVDVGPRRPFQQPPPIPPSSQHPPQGQQWSSPAPSTSNYRPPPPQHPTTTGMAPWQIQQPYRPRQIGGGGLIGSLIDTVRDIADVVSGAHDDRVMAAQRANVGAYTAPYASTSSAYAPPPAPAPPRPASTPPRSNNGAAAVPDDGTPTRTPVPGHPLLRDGNLLVYPRDHLCTKCKNTGYKNYDPSHPCRKCWEKYGRSYTGALTYTPWASSGNDTRMQRPLPKFVPPHLSPHGGPSSPSPYASPSRLQHARSVSQPLHMYSPGSGPSYYVIDPLSPYPSTPPVPHAIAVAPGDPRLGGQICWRCGGAGIRTILLIDVMTCDTCGGTGRVWT